MSVKAGRGADQFMLRLPDGMRDRIKRAAEANGSSMNNEIVSCLSSWFPDPTAEEYLAWLFRELQQLKNARDSQHMLEDRKQFYDEPITQVRSKIIDVVDGKADPNTFAEEIARISDYHAIQRD